MVSKLYSLIFLVKVHKKQIKTAPLRSNFTYSYSLYLRHQEPRCLVNTELEYGWPVENMEETEKRWGLDCYLNACVHLYIKHRATVFSKTLLVSMQIVASQTCFRTTDQKGGGFTCSKFAST